MRWRTVAIGVALSTVLGGTPGAQPPPSSAASPIDILVVPVPDEDSDASINWLLGGTAVLSLGVAWLQSRLLRKQTSLMEGELQLAKDAARQAAGSADLARRAMVDQSPPKIIVREVALEQASTLIAEPRWEELLTGHQRDERFIALSGTFRVINKGRHSARVQRIEAILVILRPGILPAENPCHDRVVAEDVALPSGVTFACKMPPLLISPNAHSDIWTGDSVLTLIGRVTYTDDFGNVRRTGFARPFSQRTGRFDYPKPDPDYEFQD